MDSLRRGFARLCCPVLAGLLACGGTSTGERSATDEARADGGAPADGVGGSGTVDGPPVMEGGGSPADAGGASPGDGATVLTDGGSAAAGRLRHPGLLSGADDLRILKQHVLNGDAPWAGEIAHLRARVAASTLRTPPATSQIYCGTYNKDPQGRTIPECNYAVDNGIDAVSVM